MNRFKLIILINFIFVINLFLVNAASNNMDISVNIDTPRYSLETRDTTLKYYIINSGNESFNGSFLYEFNTEEMVWKENKDNITIGPNTFLLIEKIIIPTSPTVHWTKIKIKDKEGKLIYSKEKPFRVHSFGETATIGATIIALISLILYLILKK